MASERSFFEDGCWVLRTSETLRFELHWSLPLFPVMTRCYTPIAFLLALWVLAVHEIGHALVVRWRGLRSYAIRMHGMGGYCSHDGGTALDEAWIAWGGVLAQLPFFVLGLVLVTVMPPGRIVDDLYVSLVLANGLMIGFNLAPIRGLDGHKAWTLFRLLRTARAAQTARAKTTAPGSRQENKDRAMWDAIEGAKKRQADKDRERMN